MNRMIWLLVVCLGMPAVAQARDAYQWEKIVCYYLDNVGPLSAEDRANSKLFQVQNQPKEGDFSWKVPGHVKPTQEQLDAYTATGEARVITWRKDAEADKEFAETSDVWMLLKAYNRVLKDKNPGMTSPTKDEVKAQYKSLKAEK